MNATETDSCEVVGPRGTIVGVDADHLISHSEVTAMLFAFADINGNVRRIVQLLEDEDGEEEVPEDDA
jgi:hypothetical protein